MVLAASTIFLFSLSLSPSLVFFKSSCPFFYSASTQHTKHKTRNTSFSHPHATDADAGPQAACMAGRERAAPRYFFLFD